MTRSSSVTSWFTTQSVKQSETKAYSLIIKPSFHLKRKLTLKVKGSSPWSWSSLAGAKSLSERLCYPLHWSHWQLKNRVSQCVCPLGGHWPVTSWGWASASLHWLYSLKRLWSARLSGRNNHRGPETTLEAIMMPLVSEWSVRMIRMITLSWWYLETKKRDSVAIADKCLRQVSAVLFA